MGGPFLRAQAGEEDIDAVDDAVEVDGEGPLPIGAGGLVERARGEDAGVVAEQPQFAEFVVDALRQGFQGVAVGNVELDGEGADFLLRQFVGDGLGGVGFDIGDDDVHAFIGAGQGDAAPDPAAAAGDQGCTSVQVGGHGVVPFLSSSCSRALVIPARFRHSRESGNLFREG